METRKYHRLLVVWPIVGLTLLAALFVLAGLAL